MSHLKNILNVFFEIYMRRLAFSTKYE